MDNESNYVCRICGFHQLDPPWGADGISPTFGFCSCCGVEFGYQDSNLNAIKSYRKEWLKKGAVWYESEKKPINWSVEIQMKNIPKIFRG